MKYLTLITLIVLSITNSQAQSKFSKQELSFNGFRNPSIGAEYRLKQISVHAGYYPTNFKSGVTTEFIKAGVTYWFMPVGEKQNPSSFYTSLSYARGLTKEYTDQNAGIAEVGFRWMIYKGINLRIGVAALAAEGKSVKINPTPGLSYSLFF